MTSYLFDKDNEIFHNWKNRMSLFNNFLNGQTISIKKVGHDLRFEIWYLRSIAKISLNSTGAIKGVGFNHAWNTINICQKGQLITEILVPSFISLMSRKSCRSHRQDGAFYILSRNIAAFMQIESSNFTWKIAFSSKLPSIICLSELIFSKM